jgi:UDP-N-acetylmuramate--alanine ligase
VGDGQLLIVESCEFDRSFLQLHPHLAAVLNIEPDHLDCYRDLDDIVDAFSKFVSQIHADGVAVINGDDPRAMRAAASASSAVETFGFSPGVDWRAEEIGQDHGCVAFRVWHRGKRFLVSRLAVPGTYNVANALAAIALAHHAGADAESIAAALPSFEGVQRRSTWRGCGCGVTVVDDYAHHPTEVRVTIDAVRRRYSPRRMWVVFQPHQHARTRQFLDAFAESFDLADEVVVPDVYGAREDDDGGHGSCGSEELVSRMCRLGVRATYRATLSAAAEHVIEHAADGDLVMTMGAGDVWKVADELVARFCGPNRA